MDINKTKEICIKKIKENIFYNILYASPSYSPNYRYYWIRDAALVYRSIIEEHKRTNLYLSEIMNYIETEFELQNTETLTGLGEPKFNPDKSAFNEPWGRPQNDGPALRGLNMIKLYNFFYNKGWYTQCNNVILPIIERDLDYIVRNYNTPSFDLWEELYGWHFYTRVVQFKFVKEYSNFINLVYKDYNYNWINNILDDMLMKINHHKSENGIISSFDTYGNIQKINDTSVIMALTHIDFDKTILYSIGLSNFKKTAETITNDFKQRYKGETYGMVGRYSNDKYYNGHIWIICSLSIAQFYLYIYKTENNIKYKNSSKKIIDFVMNINKNMDIAEQYDIDTNEPISAEKLTWNYSELYFSCKLLE